MAGLAAATSVPTAIPALSPGDSFNGSVVTGIRYEPHGTILQGNRASPDLIVRVVAGLAAGLGIRGPARVFESEATTVLQWLGEAAEQLNAFSAYCLRELQSNHVQLDALYAVLSAVRDGEMREAEAVE